MKNMQEKNALESSAINSVVLADMKVQLCEKFGSNINLKLMKVKHFILPKKFV